MVPILLILVSLGAVIAIIAFHAGYNALYDQRLSMVKAIVDVADDVVRYYGKLAETGKLPLEEAQIQAGTEISTMRYNGKDYLFGYDMDQKIVIPFQGHPRGKRLDAQDSRGTWIHREMVELIQSQGEGSLTYFWKNSNSEKVEEKVAYVKNPTNLGDGSMGLDFTSPT